MGQLRLFVQEVVSTGGVRPFGFVDPAKLGNYLHCTSEDETINTNAEYPTPDNCLTSGFHLDTDSDISDRTTLSPVSTTVPASFIGITGSDADGAAAADISFGGLFWCGSSGMFECGMGPQEKACRLTPCEEECKSSTAQI